MIMEWVKAEWFQIFAVILAYCLFTVLFYFALRNKKGSDNE